MAITLNEYLKAKNAIDLLFVYKEDRLKDLMEEGNCRSYSEKIPKITEEINKINTVFTRKNILDRINQRLIELKNNISKDESLQSYFKNKEVYYDNAKKSLHYHTSVQEKKLVSLILEHNRFFKDFQQHLMQKKKDEALYLLSEISYFKLLKIVFNSKKKRESKALEEMMRMGMCSTKLLFNDDVINQFEPAIFLTETHKSKLKATYLFCEDSSKKESDMEYLSARNTKIIKEIEELLFLKSNSVRF